MTEPQQHQRRPGSGHEIVPGAGKGGAIGLVQPGANSSELAGAPGQVLYNDDPVIINEGREVVTVTVVNTADRPISVGSHYHFAETNPALEFDRDAAWGRRMNTMAGAMTRFDPGATMEIELIPLGGRRIVRGLRGASGGALDA